MPELITNDLVKAMFQKMLDASACGDEEQVEQLLSNAEAKGLKISVEIEVEDVTWEDTYPLVVVDYVLKLGDVAVAGWQEEWSGHWGGMGAGWWLDCLVDGKSPELSEFDYITGLCDSDELYVPRSEEEVNEYRRKHFGEDDE